MQELTINLGQVNGKNVEKLVEQTVQAFLCFSKTCEL